jgi:2-keto-3-deoxy-6-phosphogluconate aldolase
MSGVAVGVFADQAVKRGLKVVKFFLAEQFGGVCGN